MAQDLKNTSRGNFSLSHSGNPTLEEIKVSCLVRIADAAESQAKSSEMVAVKYIQMEKDLRYYEAGYKRLQTETARLEKSNSALRGVITRMKNKG